MDSVSLGNALGTQTKPEQTLSGGSRSALMADFQELNIHPTTTGGFRRAGGREARIQNRTSPKPAPVGRKVKLEQTPEFPPAIQSARDHYGMEMSGLFLVPPLFAVASPQHPRGNYSSDSDHCFPSRQENTSTGPKDGIFGPENFKIH